MSDQFAAGSVSQSFGQSVNRTDKAESEMESKVSVPFSCPLACHLSADVIDMAEKFNGIMATAVISRAKWAHVGCIGPYWSALDQKDSFRQYCTAWQQTSICGQSYMCLSLSHPLSVSLSLTSWWTQNRTNSLLWFIAAVTGCAIQPSNLCSCFYPLISDAVSPFLSFPLCSCECVRVLRQCDWAERRGVTVFRGRPLRHTPMMERRRMDAALLVLFLGHFATALEVPLDRKATDHTPHNTFISKSV